MSKNKILLLPPWLAYPHIERCSIGWRMGYGEEYITKWHSWYCALTAKAADHYNTLFPEPPTWKGFGNNTDNCIYYNYKNFKITFWEKDGNPKYSLDQMCQEYQAGKKLSYCMFWKTTYGSIQKGCLSQWQNSPFTINTQHYHCMEQYMMSQKASLFGDSEIMQQILSCSDPKKIKALGRKVKGFDDAVWNKAKYSIVLNGNYHKFIQNPELKDFLLNTGDKILVEASPLDGVWGIRMAESDENAHNPLKWRGQNLLGFALMEVRDVLREVCKNESLAMPMKTP